MMRYRSIIIFFVILSHFSGTALGNWYYGAVPADCIKIKTAVGDDSRLLTCDPITQNSDVDDSFTKLNRYLEEDSAISDAKYELTLLRKLGDNKLQTLLGSYSSLALLASDSPSDITQFYSNLPSNCLEKYPKANDSFLGQILGIKKIKKEDINANRAQTVGALLEDLTHMAQLKEMHSELKAKAHVQSYLRDHSHVVNTELRESIKLTKKMIAMLESKNIFLGDPKFFKLTRPKSESGKKLLNGDIDSGLLAQLNSSVKTIANKQRKKLGEHPGFGINYLCDKLNVKPEDLLKHRTMLGIKESKIVGSLMANEDVLSEILNYQDSFTNKNISIEEKKDDIKYKSLLGSAACRLKLKVINNESIDLGRDFLISAGLTVGTMGLGTLATSGYVTTAKFAKHGTAMITAVDVGVSSLVNMPLVYEACISGHVTRSELYTDKKISAFDCALNVGFASLNRVTAGIGVKQTVRLFRPLKTRKILAKVTSADTGFNAAHTGKSAKFVSRFVDSGNDSVVIFNSENRVLKLINDKVLRDKDAVDAISNKYKSILMDAIESDPKLSKALIGKYSDYKSLKLAFDKKVVASGDINSRLLAAVKEANNKFADFCKTTGVNKMLVDKSGKKLKGVVADPTKWFASGSGSSIDEASILSRIGSDSGNAFTKNSSASKILREEVEKAEVLRVDAYKAFKGSRSAFDGEDILNEDVVALVRKSMSAGGSNRQVNGQLLKDIKKIVPDANLSRKDVKTLRAYYGQIDKFSPPVIVRQGAGNVLKDAEDIVVSFDFRGIGALNARGNMKALKDLSSGNSNSKNIVELVRAHDDVVTRKLQDMKRLTTEAINEAFDEIPAKAISFSGDDGIFKVPKQVRDAYVKKHGVVKAEKLIQEKIDAVINKVSDKMASSGYRADRVRATTIDTRTPLEFGSVSEQIVFQEGVEKNLRTALMGKYPDQDFLISVSRSAKGKYSVTVNNTSNSKVINDIENEFKHLVSKANN